MDWWRKSSSKFYKEKPVKKEIETYCKLWQYITQEKGFETGDTIDERWYPSTLRNSPRKGFPSGLTPKIRP
jgi:hypothetical protein